MEKLERTDDLKEALLHCYANIEVFFRESPARKSVFFNLMDTSRKNLSSASKFYKSLTDEQVKNLRQSRRLENVNRSKRVKLRTT